MIYFLVISASLLFFVLQKNYVNFFSEESLIVLSFLIVLCLLTFGLKDLLLNELKIRKLLIREKFVFLIRRENKVYENLLLVHDDRIDFKYWTFKAIVFYLDKLENLIELKNHQIYLFYYEFVKAQINKLIKSELLAQQSLANFLLSQLFLYNVNWKKWLRIKSAAMFFNYRYPANSFLLRKLFEFTSYGLYLKCFKHAKWFIMTHKEDLNFKWTFRFRKRRRLPIDW